MQVVCPRCGGRPGADDVNVATDVAFCRPCGEVFALSALTRAAEPPKVLGKAPRGAWFQERADGFEVGATTRSPQALFLVPFALVWCGLVIGRIYVPALSGELELIPTLVGIPFLFAAAVLLSVTAMAVAGRCVVCVRGADGEIFLGVGRLGWTRRFRWTAVSAVSEGASQWRTKRGGTLPCIILEADRRLQFGTGLTEARRSFLIDALAFMLARRERLPEAAPYRANAGHL